MTDKAPERIIRKLREQREMGLHGPIVDTMDEAADTIDRLTAELEAREEQALDLLSDIPCACGHDKPDDVCMKHYPLFRRLASDNERLRKAVDALNITALIAHALQDGQIDDSVSELFDTALAEQNAALAALQEDKR